MINMIKSDLTGLILMKIVQKYEWSWKDFIFPMQNIIFSLLILKCDLNMFLIIFARLTPLHLLLELLRILGFQQWFLSYFGIKWLYFWLCIWASESIFFDRCDLKSKHADAAPQSFCCSDITETFVLKLLFLCNLSCSLLASLLVRW